MTPPPVTCPHCDKKFRGKGDLTGKKIKCPFCKEPFVAGAAKAPAKSEAIKPAPAPVPAAVGSDDDEEDGKAYGVGDQEIEFRCPNCAEQMPSATATICLKCGYNTLTREWGKTEKTFAVDFKQHFMHLLPGLACLLAAVIDLHFVIAYNVEGNESIYLRYNKLPLWMFAEAGKMWISMIHLLIIFFLGRYAFNRLVLNPKPQEIAKES